METTFYITNRTAAEVTKFMDESQFFNFKVERMDTKSCNLTLYAEDAWKWFEEYAEANDILYQLV